MPAVTGSCAAPLQASRTPASEAPIAIDESRMMFRGAWRAPTAAPTARPPMNAATTVLIAAVVLPTCSNSNRVQVTW